MPTYKRQDKRKPHKTKKSKRCPECYSRLRKRHNNYYCPIHGKISPVTESRERHYRIGGAREKHRWDYGK